MENEIDLTQFTDGATVLFDYEGLTYESKVSLDKHGLFFSIPDNCELNMKKFHITYGNLEMDASLKGYNVRLKDPQHEPVPQPQTSAVNHPAHYNQYPKEAIDIIIDTFGVSDAIVFCKVVLSLIAFPFIE